MSSKLRRIARGLNMSVRTRQALRRYRTWLLSMQRQREHGAAAFPDPTAARG